jgi:hypothetical protein
LEEIDIEPGNRGFMPFSRLTELRL